MISAEDGGGGEEEKKRQKRGGKGMLKAKKKEDVPRLVTVSRAPRGKKKCVTVVSGLSTFGKPITLLKIFYIDRLICLFGFVLDIDLKVAAKFFGTKFACGSSVTGEDEIVIQGDVKDDLFDIIPEKWPEVLLWTIVFDMRLKLKSNQYFLFSRSTKIALKIWEIRSGSARIACLNLPTVSL